MTAAALERADVEAAHAQLREAVEDRHQGLIEHGALGARVERVPVRGRLEEHEEGTSVHRCLMSESLTADAALTTLCELLLALPTRISEHRCPPSFLPARHRANHARKPPSRRSWTRRLAFWSSSVSRPRAPTRSPSARASVSARSISIFRTRTR